MQQDFLRRQETACLVHIQEWWITLRQTKTSFVFMFCLVLDQVSKLLILMKKLPLHGSNFQLRATSNLSFNPTYKWFKESGLHGRLILIVQRDMQVPSPRPTWSVHPCEVSKHPNGCWFCQLGMERIKKEACNPWISRSCDK
jgi:hypothetical protein